MKTADDAWKQIAKFELKEKTKLLTMLADDIKVETDIQGILLNKERKKVRLARKINNGKNKAIDNVLDDENI